jgi:prevent-host-death family protein
MHAVTIKEAKARLNALIDAAAHGEQVVLMRGSKHVAVIVPISSDDLELAPSLTDAQATRLWKQLAAERAAGATTTFATPAAAVAFLGRRRSRARKRK